MSRKLDPSYLYFQVTTNRDHGVAQKYCLLKKVNSVQMPARLFRVKSKAPKILAVCSPANFRVMQCKRIKRLRVRCKSNSSSRIGQRS